MHIHLSCPSTSLAFICKPLQLLIMLAMDWLGVPAKGLPHQTPKRALRIFSSFLHLSEDGQTALLFTASGGG